jgi:transposase
MAKIKKKWHHKEVLRGMYVDQGLTMRQIAQILGTTATTIKYWMEKFNIEGRQHCIGDVTRGTQRTEEEKEYLSEVAKKRFKHPEDHPMFGHRHTEEAKRKMSETKKQRHRERQGAKI